MHQAHVLDGVVPQRLRPRSHDLVFVRKDGLAGVLVDLEGDIVPVRRTLVFGLRFRRVGRSLNGIWNELAAALRLLLKTRLTKEGLAIVLVLLAKIDVPVGACRPELFLCCWVDCFVVEGHGHAALLRSVLA